VGHAGASQSLRTAAVAPRGFSGRHYLSPAEADAWRDSAHTVQSGECSAYRSTGLFKLFRGLLTAGGGRAVKGAGSCPDKRGNGR